MIKHEGKVDDSAKKTLLSQLKALDKIKEGDVPAHPPQLVAGNRQHPEAMPEDIAALSHADGGSLKPQNSSTQLTEAVLEAARSTTMSPDKKAQAVYRHSLDLFSGLFETPTAEFIKNSKKAVGGVVDMILEDDDTAINLLKVTSHDFYTYTHSVNVGVLSVCLAKQLFKGKSSHNLREFGAGAFLHDLGKVKVDPAILNKPGRLDDWEMKRMRIHPYQSYRILMDTSQLSEECAIIAMQHHEREDGTGYPLRLKGKEIHEYGKIGCIADVYDALTAKRSYKEGMPPFKALQIMKEEMIHHFEKEIFQNFVLLFSK
ncbi:MAG: HD-GYP domain-containing protein [Magnetococcales bacterium]|nr:HD-GYP domain-containing protein [Magnetococcales bacterium]